MNTATQQIASLSLSESVAFFRVYLLCHFLSSLFFLSFFFFNTVKKKIKEEEEKGGERRGVGTKNRVGRVTESTLFGFPHPLIVDTINFY